MSGVTDRKLGKLVLHPAGGAADTRVSANSSQPVFHTVGSISSSCSSRLLQAQRSVRSTRSVLLSPLTPVSSRHRLSAVSLLTLAHLSGLPGTERDRRHLLAF